MRQYNITKIGFPSDRLREMCVDNFNAISASIKSIISQVRANKSRIDRNEEVLSRAVVTDANGNIAYGGATIPGDVDSAYFHIFYPNGSCRVVDFNGSIFDTSNAYVRTDSGTPRWQYIASGKAGLFVPTANSNQFTLKYDAIDSGGQLPTGVNIPWVLVTEINTSGNINIKTGSTYTATL